MLLFTMLSFLQTINTVSGKRNCHIFLRLNKRRTREHFDLPFANTLHKYTEAPCEHDIDLAVQLGAHKNTWLGPHFPCTFPNRTFSKRTAQNTNSKHLTSNRQLIFLWPPTKNQRYPSPSPEANPPGKHPLLHLPSPWKRLVLLAGEGGCGFRLFQDKPVAALGKSP